MKRFYAILLVLCLFLSGAAFPARADEYKERPNSWRYQDGELLTDMSIPSALSEASHPNATLMGIDVSHHQGKIDWEAVRNSGIDFVFIRCGFGMDQTDQDDATFEYNASECERLGIPYGVYIYSYAATTEQALSEADHVLRLINGRTLSYPVYYDMEDDSTAGSDHAAIATAFCEKIAAAGYPVGVYANVYWWSTYLTDPCFDNWYRWVAQYDTTCEYAGKFALWQYSSSGSVNGITGNVDMNYLIGSPADHGTGVTQHIYEGTVTQPTCIDPGFTTHSCRLCGNSYVGNYVSASGIHSYFGSDDASCNVCGAARLVLPTTPEGAEYTPMYRLYNPNSGEHFYTGSTEETQNLSDAGWQYEGVAWNAPTSSGDPVYRLYNPNSGDHHYTMSAEEQDMLVGFGWQYEGICWNSASPENLPLYRLYNPNADCGSHHYTGSAEERDFLESVGWIYEGIGWFGILK